MSDDLSGFSMIELFRSEVEGQAAVLSAGLLALESAEVDPATLEAMMRAAHSIKGAARIVGLEAAVRVAHALEDCFVSAQHAVARILAESDSLAAATQRLLPEVGPALGWDGGAIWETRWRKASTGCLCARAMDSGTALSIITGRAANSGQSRMI